MARQIAYLKSVETPTDREILKSHSEQIAELQRSVTDLTTELKKRQRTKSKIKSKARSKSKTRAKFNRFRNARIKHGLSVAEVAKQVGVSQSSVYFWETDYCQPRERSLTALCKALKLPAKLREITT